MPTKNLRSIDNIDTNDMNFKHLETTKDIVISPKNEYGDPQRPDVSHKWTAKVSDGTNYVGDYAVKISGASMVVDSEDFTKLPVGKYQLEIWEQWNDVDGTSQLSIYPSPQQTIPFTIYANITDQAGKDDIAGLVKQTELAEYVKKNGLPSIPNLTDYVKKEELPKQPDLTKYALKSELPDLTSFLKTADADKKFATKSEIPSLDGYAKKTDLPKEPDLSNYATKDDLKTVTSNTTRHAPTGWTLDRTTNPWTIWFDNGCGIQYPSYYNDPVIYGQGNFEANVGNDLSRSCPHKTMIRISNGSFLPYKYANREIEVFANYDKNIKVINPIRTDADKFDWSRCYGNKNTKSDGTFDEELLQKKTQFARAVYEVGIWSEEDLKPFGLVKK